MEKAAPYMSSQPDSMSSSAKMESIEVCTSEKGPQYHATGQALGDSFPDVEKDAMVRTTTRESRKSGKPLTSNPLILLLDFVTRKSQSLPSHLPAPPAPDGGLHPWLVVLFAHLVGFNTWGLLNTFGILQTYYSSTLSLPPSTVSWIGSTQMFSLFFFAFISGRLTDAGYFHQTFFIGCVLHLTGIFSASFSTTYWQLLLSQGICCGLGGGLMFCPAVSVCATYFKRHQSLVLGICAAGTSTGGLFYAIIMQQLMPRLGFAWTLRVIGFIVAGCLIPANFVLQPRKIARSMGPMVEWSAFREKQYAFFTAGIFFVMVGMWIPVYYVGSFGRDIIGISTSDSSLLILVINAAGIAGRIPPIILANTLTGPMNMLLPFTFLTSVILLCWIAVHDRGGLIAFDVFYGLVVAAGQGLYPPSLGSLTTDMSKMGVRNGMSFTVVSLGGLVGSPLAGALIQAHGGGYLYAQIWSGGVIAVGSVFLWIARMAKTEGKFWVKV